LFQQEENQMSSVFISYSSYDRPDALEIRRILESNGCKVWLDAFDLNPSENLKDGLVNNIKMANVFCILLSPTASASKWVNREIKAASAQCEEKHLKLIAIMLRPCEVPSEISGKPYLKAYEYYDGLKNENIRLQLVRWVLNPDAVPDKIMDEAQRKYYADLSKQEEAFKELPQLSAGLQLIRDKPIESIEIKIEKQVFAQLQKDDPCILQLRLSRNSLFYQPMSLFFAPFKEGNTWPTDFDLIEPPYTKFRSGQPLIDAKFKWYDYVQDLQGVIDGTDLGELPAGFTANFDGSKYQPSSSPSKFRPNIQLPVNIQIPSLKELIEERSEFQVILHYPSSKTAKVLDLQKTDLNIKVIARYDEEKLQFTLFKSRHTNLEKIILKGEYLSGIQSPIEREAILSFYKPSNQIKTEGAHEKDQKRWAIHRMTLLDPNEISWDDDRRLIVRVLQNRIDLDGLRRRSLQVFQWSSVPGIGEKQLRDFLTDDFNSQEKFAYLIYDSIDEIAQTKITKDDKENIIQISNPNKPASGRLILKPDMQNQRINVYQFGDDGIQRMIYAFCPKMLNETDFALYLVDDFDALNDCQKIILLMEPLVFDRPKPIYDDGYKMYSATRKMVIIHQLWRSFDDASLDAADLVEIATRMKSVDPQENRYKRWLAQANLLLAQVEVAQKTTRSLDLASKHMEMSIELFEELFNSLKSMATMTDLIQALKAVVSAPAIVPTSSTFNIKDLTSKLTVLEEDQKKVSDFLNALGIESDNFVLAKLITDTIDVNRGEETRNGIAGTYVAAKPKFEYEQETWLEINKVLKTNGFEWTRVLLNSKENLWDKYWEKWIADKQQT
jgi:hypothetical protein